MRSCLQRFHCRLFWGPKPHENQKVIDQTTSNWLTLLFAIIVLSSAALRAQTVNILQPQATGTMMSPVPVRATISDSSAVRLTQVYVDGLKRFESFSSGVNTWLPMSNGAHKVSVQAMDAASRVFKSTVYITVGGAPPPTPGGGTVLRNIQQMTGWQTCGACGNVGGTGAVAHYTLTRGITAPSLSGSSSRFAIGGGGSAPFSNGYWYIGHPALNRQIASLTYSFDLYVPTGDENDPQAIEFECQQRV